MPFPMHFNQQATRHNNSNIPWLFVGMYHYTILHHNTCRLSQAVCFYSIQPNQLIFVQ